MDEQHKEQAYQLANIGHWELDVVNEQLYWSDQVKRLHEVPLDYKPDLESALDFYEKGEPTSKAQTAVRKAIDEGKSFSIESTIITAKGNRRWVKAVGEPVMEDGQCVCIYGSTQDISNRKTMEQQLQRERDRLSKSVEEKARILERIDDGFFAVDDNWIVSYWNKEAEHIMGISQDRIIGRNLWDVFEEATELEFYEQYHKALNQQVTVQFEEFYHPQDMWIEVTAYPSKAGLSVYFRNITERKQTRQDLQNKKKQLRNIADNIKGSILCYQLHPDGSDELVFASEGIKDLLGITPQQATESTDLIWSQIVDGNREEVQRSIEESAKNMCLWNHTFKIQTPTGQQKWIHGRGTPQQLDDGSIQWDTILHDITEQKQLEDEIAQQITLLNHILDSLPGLFFILDEDLRFVRVNQNVEQLYGQTAEQLQGSNALEFVAPRARAEAKQAIEVVLTDGYAELETILLDGDDREHHYYLSGNYFESNGKKYILGNGIDITERVEAEEENAVLLQEVHHRVKNNLAIISGILTLELDELPFSSRNRLPIERSVNRIHAIAKVHELLYQTSNFSQINVNEYISDLATTVTNTLHTGENEVDIQLNVAEINMNINEIIPLGMLLNELLTNSLKYAFNEKEQGIITLDISQEGQSYKVIYRDNGQGFDQQDFDESKTLGLTIVNILLQQLQAEYDISTDNGFEIMFRFDKRATGSHANL